MNTLSTYPSEGASLSTLTADGIGYASAGMENIGDVSAETYFMGTAEAEDSGAAGMICIIDRGVISFQDKVANCENSGGVGAIVINNEAGMLYGTLGDPNNTSIPAVGAALANRTSLLATSNAAIRIGTGDYGYMSGTSMATPGAAGVAALIWSNNPNCIGADVRQAMKDSAENQGAADRDDNFGYGIVKAAAANAVLSGLPCGGSSAGNVPPTVSFTFACTSLDCTFDAGASSDSDGIITSYAWDFGDANTASGIAPSYTYSATGSYTATLTVTDNESATGVSSQTVNVSDGSTPVVSDITLTGSRAGNRREITIEWVGATTANVDVYINGNYNSTTADTGSITYRVSKKATYTFVVCEAGSTVACSNEVGPL